MLTIDQIAGRCEKVRWNGKASFIACCVAHDDRNPSMSVTEAQDGTILVHCHAGCPQDMLLDAFGMTGTNSNRICNTYKAPPPRPKAEKPTSKYAQQIWQTTKPDELKSWDQAVASHPYAIKKELNQACGAARGNVSGRLIGKHADSIIIPMRTLQGSLTGVECINGDGVKQTFGSKGVLTLGNTLDKSLPIYVVEGWADGAAAWRYYGNAVVLVTFGKCKQESTARRLNELRPERDIIIVRDAA